MLCLWVSLRQQGWFLFASCGFQPQTLSPSWSGTNGGSWSPWMLCFPQSPLAAVPPAMGPSAFSIKRHVCAPHLFVLTDDFCNKTQTFWYFLDSWVMTLRFAFFGLVAVSRGKCSLQKLLAVFWCVCGLKWRIEWVLPMLCLPQLRADPLCARERTRWEISLCHLVWDTTVGPENLITAVFLLFCLIITLAKIITLKRLKQLCC